MGGGGGGKQKESSEGLCGPKGAPSWSARAHLCPPDPPRQQELLFHFLQLSAAVEHYQQKFRSQASVIDEIVDTAFEVNQAGPERRGQGGGGTLESQAGGCAQKWP